MNKELAQLLEAHHEAIVHALPHELSQDPDCPAEVDPAQLVTVTEAAVSTGDVTVLAELLGLNRRAPSIEHAVAAVLASIDALSRATHTALAHRVEAQRLHALEDGFEQLSRRAAEMGVRLGTETGASSAQASVRTTSISITMHELRRPLTIMSSYGQLLASGALGELPEGAELAVENITASVDMMIRLVNSLGEVSRLEDPDDPLVMEEFSVSELVAGAIEHVAMEAQLRDLRIDTDMARQPLNIRGDRRKLVLALTNLLSNAVKHTPEHSGVEVMARQDGGRVHIIVADRGPGISEQDAVHLFDKYFRSASDKQRGIPGTGLGLYIVKTVLERHGGTAAGRPREGGGAEFELVLPILPPGANASAG